LCDLAAISVRLPRFGVGAEPNTSTRAFYAATCVSDAFKRIAAQHASQQDSRLVGFADALFFVIAKTALIGDIVSARHRHRRLNLYKPDQLPALRT
jgi:predicted nucleic acid-binding protein